MKYYQRWGSMLLVIALVLVGVTQANAQSPLNVGLSSGNAHRGNMFDIKALTGVSIQSFDVSFTGTTDIEVYALTAANTSFVGSELNPAAWTLVGTVLGVVGGGPGVAVPLNLSLNHPVNAGEIQGWYVTSSNIAVSLHYSNGTVAGALWASNTDLEFYEGKGGEYPFNITFSPRVWNGVIHYTPLALNLVDLRCVSIDSPVIDMTSCVGNQLTSTETISLTFQNLGSADLFAFSDAIMVLVDLDAVNILTETFFSPVDIPSLGSVNYNTVGTVDMSALGVHTLTVSTTLVGDGDTSNDTCNLAYSLPGSVPVGVGYFETFDSLPGAIGTEVPASWVNAQDDPYTLAAPGANGDWRNIIGQTSSLVSPLNDHTQGPGGTGVFMYIEDSQANANDIELRTPCLDTSTSVNTPTIQFWYANTPIAGAAANLLNIDIINESSGITTSSVLVLDGQGDFDWHANTVDLSAFAPDIVRIQFRANTNNTGFSSDVAIDDFAFFDAIVGAGQAPQPGNAVFDINNSINTLASPVSSNQNGPYAANIVASGQMTMTWSGQNNGIMICLFGPGNDAIASFPGVGQLDIGTLPLNSGIPSNIFVFGDGSPGAQFPFGPLFNSFFFTGPAGIGGVDLVVPGHFLPGPLTRFQCVMNPAGMFFISNAVDVTVL